MWEAIRYRNGFTFGRLNLRLANMNVINRQNVLWIDCLGGLLVGVLVLLFSNLISEWDSLPLGIIRFVGFANLVYGSYSLWVTTRVPRKVIFVKILAIANMAWLLVCIMIIAMHWNDISLFGVSHKLAEGIYVASLGVIEWRWRKSLGS